MSVEVEVRSQLTKIVEDLQAIQKQAQGLSSQLAQNSEDVGKKTKEQTKSVQGALSAMGQFGRRIADQLRQDFAALASLGSLTAGLKLSNQFSGSVKEAVSLSDTVRRLGSVFGIAGKDFSNFQSLMQKGLGEIGLSSEAAANALNGLAETPVRGQANLMAYAKTAGELASISGQKGQEGNIAKGAAGIITARGGNVNDQKELQNVTKEILQVRQATGKSVTDITAALQDIYAKTNKDFQKNLKGGGSTSLATAALQAGPQATQFLEKYLSMNRIERKGLEAQGFKGVVGQNGELNNGAIQSTMAEAKKRGLGDAQAGLKTFGFSDDEAKGFIRLSEAMKANEAVINGASKQVVNLNDQYRQSMSMGDSFRANINKVKGIFSDPIARATQGFTGFLGKASETTGGAAGVMAGGGVLAAVLAGGGLKGIGKMLNMGEMMRDEAKSKAIEAITGEHVQKVEVVNFPGEGGEGGAASTLLGGAKKAIPAIGGAASAIGGTLTTGVGALGAGTIAAGALVAGGVGYGLGTLANKYSPTIEGKNADGVEGGAIERLFAKIDSIFGGENSKNQQRANTAMSQDVRVKVELNKNDLKHAKPPNRGGHQ